MHVAPGFQEDAFLTVFNASGTDLAYSTYLSGDRDDLGSAVAVDGQGSVFVTGQTTAVPASKKFFPTTPGAFQTTPHEGGIFTSPSGVDGFVTHLNGI